MITIPGTNRVTHWRKKAAAHAFTRYNEACFANSEYREDISWPFESKNALVERKSCISRLPVHRSSFLPCLSFFRCIIIRQRRDCKKRRHSGPEIKTPGDECRKWHGQSIVPALAHARQLNTKSVANQLESRHRPCVGGASDQQLWRRDLSHPLTPSPSSSLRRLQTQTAERGRGSAKNLSLSLIIRAKALL